MRGRWRPPITLDASNNTTQEATTWIFFYINGQWYGAGGERMRPGQTDKDLARPSIIGYRPKPGELVGFMVAAGSTRADNRTNIRERTAIMVMPFPGD